MADQFITFHIYLTNQADVRRLQALHPEGWIHGPEPAATELTAELGYTVTYQRPDQPFVAPCVRTPYNPTGSSGKFFTDRAVFTINNGGFWGFFGASTRFIWVGFFEYSPPPTPPDPPGTAPAPPQVAMAQRFNISGFEIPGNASVSAEGGTGAVPEWISRDASRTLEGFGYAYRGLNTVTLVKTPGDHVSPAPTPNATWHRIYIRIREFPSGAQGFYRTAGFPSASAGTALEILPGGQIQVSNFPASGAATGTYSTSALEKGRWYRLDMLSTYNPSAPQFSPTPPFPRIPTFGSFDLYIDGMQELHYVADDINMGGVGDNSSRLQSATVGPYTGVTLRGLELDVDDWVISNLPINDVNGNRTGLDWLNGSHMQLVLPTSFGAGHANWTGDFRNLLLRPTFGSSSVARLSSSVSGAVLSALTDAKFSAESRATVLGMASMIVALWSSRVSGDGTLGWSIDGGAFDLATIVQNTTEQWNNRMYRPAGQVLPIAALDPLELRHVHGASATASLVGGLQAVVELIGTFGPEDINPGERYPVYNEWTATWGGVGLSYSAGSHVRHNGVNYTNIATAESVDEPGVSAKWVANPLTSFEVGDRVYYGRNLDTNSGANFKYVCIQAHSEVHIPGESGSEAYWEVEDDVAALPPVGVHNAPYPSTPWAGAAAPPISPVSIISGTYVGNGTGQDLIFRFPVHWFWSRPLTGDTGGVHWWTSMIGAHRNYQYRIESENLVQAMMDPTYVSPGGATDPETRALIRLAGANTQSNAVGVTYQYVAFCDPGERFLTNGSFAHGSSPQVDLAINNLIDSGFTPEAAFFIIEQIGVTNTNSFYYKGPGYGLTEGQESIGTLNTLLAQFGAGQIQSRTPLHVGGTQQTAFSAWRKDDGSGDVGVPSVLKVGSYIGNGVASRGIAFSPASGKRPLFAFVIGHGSGASGSLFRDPSHTGTTSQNVGTGTSNASTGITGGDLDGMTVGSALNSSGVIYDYFVLMGSTTAGSGGWSVNGEFIPVGPAPAPGDNYPPGPDYNPDDPEQPLIPPTDGGGGEPTPGTPTSDIDTTTTIGTGTINVGGLDGGQTCEFYTRQLVNRALKRIGISKRIANLATDATIEAVSARDIIVDDINQVLRDFDWPFATRYSDLVVVGGTTAVPVNADWQYSYRAPSGLLKVRRIVGQAGERRAYDPNPIEFKLGSDGTGNLIYSNAAIDTSQPVVLEYTVRPSCAAFYGDALFRDALAWKFAASLAMPLARDSNKMTECLDHYKEALANAKVPAANEGQPAKDGDAPWIVDRG